MLNPPAKGAPRPGGRKVEQEWNTLWAHWDEIVARVAPVALDVVVNGRALAPSIGRSALAGEAARRGGVMVEMGRAGARSWCDDGRRG
jgi:hypothetical protein